MNLTKFDPRLIEPLYLPLKPTVDDEDDESEREEDYRPQLTAGPGEVQGPSVRQTHHQPTHLVATGHDGGGRLSGRSRDDERRHGTPSIVIPVSSCRRPSLGFPLG